MSNSDLVRASRDGDYFHYLWAARRCLPLLSPQSGLVAITIEGASPAERQSGGALNNGEELIDVGEYYGSEDLKQATLIRYIQLKHSTRNVSDEWTASGLEKTLRGFADRYQAIQKDLQGAPRLQMSLVTNRPISAAVREAVEDAARGRAARHPGELAKLERLTGFSGAELASFCNLLRFEGTQPGYWDQRNILSEDVSGYLPDSDVDAPTQLKELVTRKALSESAAKLLATEPLHFDPQGDEEFSDWIGGHDITRRDKGWLADRRNPCRSSGRDGRAKHARRTGRAPLLAPIWTVRWGSRMTSLTCGAIGPSCRASAKKIFTSEARWLLHIAPRRCLGPCRVRQVPINTIFQTLMTVSRSVAASSSWKVGSFIAIGRRIGRL